MRQVQPSQIAHCFDPMQSFVHFRVRPMYVNESRNSLLEINRFFEQIFYVLIYDSIEEFLH